MSVLILDDYEASELIERRRESPAYRWDEIWDGVYVIPPIPDNFHSELSTLFVLAFYSVYPEKLGCHAYSHINISDRNKSWMENVRCPDAALFLDGNNAKNRRTHWQGGPDLLVEVVMPGDRCREKLDFYGKVGTREAIILDRDPWRLELHRLRRSKLYIWLRSSILEVVGR